MSSDIQVRVTSIFESVGPRVESIFISIGTSLEGGGGFIEILAFNEVLGLRGRS